MGSTTSNGVCAKDKQGKRKHDMVMQTDGNGISFRGCVKCGAVMINTTKRNFTPTN